MKNDIIYSSDLSLHSDEYPFSLSLRIREFPDEKSIIRFIKACERMVRSSLEYKEWRQYIFDVLGLTTCSLTHENRDDVTIEIHHAPVSLFTIIKAIVNEKLSKNQEFSSFEISLETMVLHFQNIIGYIPLITSMHEKVHNGKLKIPIDLVHGNYREFLNNFWTFIDEAEQQIINERLATTRDNCTQINWEKDLYPGLTIDTKSEKEIVFGSQ